MPTFQASPTTLTRPTELPRPTRLPRAEEQELFRRYAACPTPAGRTELVERFLPLARKLASRYAGRSESFEDLFQIASLGLLQAIDRFDPERGTTFSTFAVPTILGELRRHFRDRTWSIHMPRGLQETILEIEKAMEELPTRLGRAATVADVAERIGITEEKVLEGINASQSRYARSFEDSPLNDDGESIPLTERIGRVDGRFEITEDSAEIQDAVRGLPDRDREILHLRFVEDLTQREIADRVGVSQMQISRVLRSTLDRLRGEVGGEVTA